MDENQTSQETTEDVLFSGETQEEVGNETTSENREDGNESASSLLTDDEQENSEERDVKQEQSEDWNLEKSETSKMSDDRFKEAVEFAKENGLSKEAAEAFVKKQEEFELGFISHFEKQRKEQTEAWAKETKNDPEIGGKFLKESVETARRALNEFASPELIQFMRQSGYGNNPHVIRMFSKIGKLLSDDSIVMGDKGVNAQLSAAEVLYGNGNQGE